MTVVNRFSWQLNEDLLAFRYPLGEQASRETARARLDGESTGRAYRTGRWVSSVARVLYGGAHREARFEASEGAEAHASGLPAPTKFMLACRPLW